MNEEHKYCVYKHTTPNNKVYIGITSKHPEERWMSGYGYRKNSHFQRAINKYGWKNIKHEVLYSHLTQLEAENKEKELIKLYKSNNRNFGYNNDNGGLIGKGKKTETEKKHQSEDKKEKWRNTEYRNMVLDKLIKKHGLKVECIETHKKYKSLVEAQNDTGINKRRIKECCEGIREEYKGFHWCYWGDNWFRDTTNYKDRANSIKIDMFDLDNNYIKTFKSIEEAGRETNISPQSIRRRLLGVPIRKKVQNKYIWKYHNEIEGGI